MIRRGLRGWASALGLAALVASCGKGPGPEETTTVRSAVTSNVVVTVRDGAGVLQAGIEVGAMHDNGSIEQIAVTNASGQATLSLPASTYRFDVYEANSDFFSGAVGHCVTPSPCTTAQITVTRVDVAVVDTTGAPLANHTLIWESTGGIAGGYVATGANGHALIATPAGAYRFVDEVNGFDFYSGASGHCTVPTCTTATITETQPVTVTVTDTAGAPQSGLVVSWSEPTAGAGGWISTNGSGVAVLSVPPGSLTFKVLAGGTEFASTPTCAVPGCTAAAIVVSQPTVVTVLDGNGNPISGRAVTPVSTEGTTSGNKSTNPSGQATFQLPLGHWQFKAKCSGTNETFYSGNAGHCAIPGGCVMAQIRMPCGQCASASNGTTCNDQNPCTAASTCLNHLCTGASPVSCSGGDACHDAGACNAQTGTCSGVPKPDGTSCDDNNACTGASSCLAGACHGTSPVTCPPPDACHDAGTCNATTGACSNPPKADGTTCGSGNVCTGASSCVAGVCTTGSPANVDDGNPCTADSCDPVSGVLHTPLAAGTNCAGGGPPCSGTQVCDGHGACVAIADGNSCTMDVCDPGQGVAHVPVAAGTPCAGSACPGNATCDGSGSCSSCVGGQIQVQYRGNQVASGGQITVPSVLAGSRGVVASLTLSNVGTGDLILSGTPNVTITGTNAADFSIQKFPPDTLASGKSAPIQVKFAPATSGVRTASLQISSNDPSNAPFTIALTATALSTSDLGADSNGDWTSGAAALCNTREARLMARTGDIDNLGFGWPSGFDPFSGFNTPAHGYPWAVNPSDPGGTDRIMLGTSYNGPCQDGYSCTTSRPANLPQCVVLNLQAECFDGTLPSSAILQMFVDDFQPRVWGSLFHVTLNGKRATQIEDGINLLAQTGPIGKLMTFTLTPEQLPLLQSGTVSVCIDDPTTGHGDGYALDFVKLLVDAYGTDYKGTINGQVTDSRNGTPIAGAKVSAGGVVETTADANGNYAMSNVPAGNVYLYASAPGYETRGQIIELQNAQTITVNIAMGPNQPPAITSTPVTQVLVGATYSYRVVATDPDNDSLTYGIPLPPPGLTFNEFTGQITWTPTADQVGTWPISVEVNDRRGGVATQTFDIHVGTVNAPPVVTCQPDVHLVGSNATLTIWCRATDDGQVNGVLTPEWYWAYKGSNVPTLTPVGTDRAQVDLSAPGIYEFVLTANDGQYQVSDSVVVTLSPTTDPPLTVFAGVDQIAVDMAATLVGTVLGGNLPSVEWSQIDGPALAQIGTPVATSTEVVFPSFGTYQFRLTATDGESTDHDEVTVFVQPPNGPPFNPTQGWIGAPLHQSTVTGLADITVGAGVTLASGTVSYWPTSAPGETHTLATGVSGGQGTKIATLDTTLLSNGSYIIQLDATNTTGQTQVSQVMVTVTGEYKPGRVVVEVTDFTLPLAGLPITVGRRYDSLEKDTVGDFGNGWSLALGHPKLEVDPSHGVTITLPNGKRTTFQFGGQPQPFPFSFLYAPVFVPEPGVFGTLTSDGCDLLVRSGDDLVCFEVSDLQFAPTMYTYTDPYGRAFVMGATGELRSITDRQGHKLTFMPDGITDSGTGRTVAFNRDATGRITTVTAPPFGTPAQTRETSYEYDGVTGDLVKVKSRVDATHTLDTQYEYEGHRLTKTTDPRGNPGIPPVSWTV